MDASKDQKGEEDKHPHPDALSNSNVSHTLETKPRGSISSVSSLDSQDRALVGETDERVSSDMEGVGDAYRRRRAQLMASLGNGNSKGRTQGGKRSGRRRTPDDKRGIHSSDDELGSDFSSLSTSDDVEMSQFASGDAMTDDEETGLTKKDKEHRKRKRRRNTRLDGRVAGNGQNSKNDQNSADRNVIKAMTINVLLILAWYLFSLSISIVG